MSRPTLKAVIAPAALSLLAACASTGTAPSQEKFTGVDVGGIIIQNGLTHTVMDVMVVVPATGRFAGCGNILPRTVCKTAFPAVDYSSNAIQVTWKEHGETQGTDEFIVDMPPRFGPGDEVWLEVVIYSPGLAGARFVQP